LKLGGVKTAKLASKPLDAKRDKAVVPPIAGKKRPAEPPATDVVNIYQLCTTNLDKQLRKKTNPIYYYGKISKSRLTCFIQNTFIIIIITLLWPLA